MTKTEIQHQLTGQHEVFTALIVALSEADFLFAQPNKWTAGQQLEHIYKSVMPVRLAFALPKFLPRLLFGSANRPSKSYDALVNKYQEKLAAGGKAPKAFVPQPVGYDQSNALKNKLLRAISNLNRQLNRFSEAELDHSILPHPLLGKITLREMLYFTIYHVQHHHKAVVKGLERHP